jgi:hypothetical protein
MDAFFKSLIYIFICLGFWAQSYGATKKECSNYLLEEIQPYDFTEVQNAWMRTVVNRLNKLTFEAMRSGLITDEKELYRLVSKQSGISYTNILSHFKGRIPANLKFAKAVADVLNISVDQILAKDFFDLFFVNQFVIRPGHFYKRYFFVMRTNLDFLFWSRVPKILSQQQLEQCLGQCSLEMILAELNKRGIDASKINIKP